MPSPRSRLGAQGEAIAAAHLEAKGMSVIDRNYRSRYGEVDLVARDGDTFVFVEVKARRGTTYGTPEESVTRVKRERLTLTAELYLQAHGIEQSAWRIDVVGIALNADGPAVINHVVAV